MKIIPVWSLCILAISFFVSCDAQKPVEGISLMNCTELVEVLDKSPAIQLVDVRTPDEYKDGSIAHAVNIDFHAADFKEQIGKLDKTKPLYIFCAKGGRSAAAANICKEAGFKSVYDLEGGYTQWQATQPKVK